MTAKVVTPGVFLSLIASAFNSFNHEPDKGKGKGRVLAIALLTRELLTRSTL